MKKDIAGRYCMQHNHFMEMSTLNFLSTIPIAINEF